MKIMRVKQPDGTLVNIPIGKGADGKSAYEYAKDGGYAGTEQEFAEMLASIENNTGGDGGVTEEVVETAITTHNASTSAHADIRTALNEKADKSEGTFFVEGSGTTDSTNKVSTWTGTSDRVTEYYDGLAIRYKIGIAGQTTTTLNINGLGEKIVYRFGTTKLTTQFPVGSVINLIYHADLNDGCWMCNDYDANTNTQQRVYETNKNIEYPITTRYNVTDGETYYAEYGRYTNGVTLNPSTNTITATKFKGALTGNADTATKATQDSSGNVITSTYETKADATTKLNNINSQISQLSSEKVAVTAQTLTEEQKAQARENIGIIGIPDYVKAEAEEVADKVISSRTANSLVLLMATDIHELTSDASNYESNKTAIEHLGMGMAEIRKHTRPDAVVLLGDYVYETSTLNKAEAKSAMKRVIVSLYDATNGIPSIWLDGNHDHYQTSGDHRLTDGENYALVGANNSQEVEVDADNLTRNYGYIDFKKQRIRLIYLNTTDISGGVASANYITNTQGQWLINTALDMSGKEDADKWGIVLCSHFPIHMYVFNEASQYYGTEIFPDLKEVICAYKDKTSGTNYGISYDFSSATAELIATFHGHTHNFKVTDVATDGGNTVKAICIPNACQNRENPYGEVFQEVDSSGNAVSYPKTAGTAEDTSFNAIVIDRDNKKIYAHCYGAGYDRVISYTAETTTYNITTTLKNCIGGSENATTINSNGATALTFTANDGYELPDSVVVSNATYVWNKTTGILDISYPTGDVSVTITATEIQTTSYTNQIPISTDASGAIYNGTGYKDGIRLGSDGTDRTNAATDATGYIPVKYGDMVYLANCQILKGATYNQVAFYKADKSTLITVRNITDVMVNYWGGAFDENNYLTQIQMKVSDNSFDLSEVAFVRFAGNYIGADSIITVNQPIE